MGDIYFQNDITSFLQPWLQNYSAGSTEVRYIHDAVNQLESVVNLRTGATWIGIEPKANRGNYWYQGALTRNAISVETWREKYYEEEGLSDGSSAATEASSSNS